MSAYQPSERTRVRRKPSRGGYDVELVHSILDEALTCHVGFVADGQPYVIPTIHARLGEVLYLHGSPSNRMLGALAEGTPCCVTATLTDGLVLARSATQHSLNYRSAIVFGTAREVSGEEQKRLALRTVVEHMVPGRADVVRGPDERELDGVAVVAVAIEEASAKVRSGPAIDKTVDVDPERWAGVLPLALTAGSPMPDESVAEGLPAPEQVRNWRRG
jgi:nitroimidazol reductase NimA-like FMN-containing flavoprotein (pyridoxamine 5'-phosphate oxidase superfamily)